MNLKYLLNYYVHGNINNDQITINYQILNSKNKVNNYNILIKYQTQITTILDPDEIIEENKLGEGSFGIVYKGKFRGNIVAIKKLKDNSTNKRINFRI